MFAEACGAIQPKKKSKKGAIQPKKRFVEACGALQPKKKCRKTWPSIHTMVPAAVSFCLPALLAFQCCSTYFQRFCLASSTSSRGLPSSNILRSFPAASIFCFLLPNLLTTRSWWPPFPWQQLPISSSHCKASETRPAQALQLASSALLLASSAFLLASSWGS